MSEHLVGKMKHKKDKEKRKEKKRKKAKTIKSDQLDRQFSEVKDKKKSKDRKRKRSEKITSDQMDLPFAELIRRKRKYKNACETTIDSKNTNDDGKEPKYGEDGDSNKEHSDLKLSSLNNIEEQIKSLEADLSDQSSSDDDDESSDDDALFEKKEIICFSNCSSDLISPLPTTVLPKNKRRYLKVDNKSKANNSSHINNSDNNEHHQGLKKAVNSLLQNYTPRSNERLPFYCRVCNIQSSSLEEFNLHKQTELHQLAIKEEKKASYCRICRKQFTSITQMKEHLKAKPHKDKVDFMINKNKSLKKFS